MTEMPPAMIFAAGRGLRMGALTAHQPKPMIPVAGRPLIDYALDIVANAGVRRAVVNTHYRPQGLAAHLAREDRLEVHTLHEEVLLETGGGLRNALPLLGSGPVWTVNADAIWSGPNPLGTLAAEGPLPHGARLLLVPKARARGHKGAGDFFLEADGTLRRRGAADSAPFVYTGVQLIDPTGLAAVDKRVFSLNVIWDRMLAAGHLRGTIYPGDWCDVGQPESLLLAETLVADG